MSRFIGWFLVGVFWLVILIGGFGVLVKVADWTRSVVVEVMNGN